MPKRTHKIVQFHGGLNSNSDPRDIAENQLSDATDIMVDEVGKVRMMGAMSTSVDPPANIAVIAAGYGLFQFSHDRIGGNVGTEHLNERIDPSSSHWDVTGGGDFNSDTVLRHTHATNPTTSTFAQTAANRELKGANSCNYKFTYTIAHASGSESNISNFKIVGGSSQFADEDASLTQTVGTHETTFLSKSDATDQPFTISITTTGTAVITIDFMSLIVSNAAATGDDYLVMADTDSSAAYSDSTIDIYSRNDNLWATEVISDSGDVSGMKPVFYAVDGNIRICDANFANDNTPKWYGYTHRTHFAIDDTSPPGALGTKVAHSKWVSEEPQMPAPTYGLLGLGNITGTQLVGNVQGGSATSGTVLIDTDAFTYWSDIGHFLQNTYIAVNTNTNKYAKVMEWNGVSQLTTTTITGDWTAGDGWHLYPEPNTGFNVKATWQGTGTWGDAISYEFAASFVYDDNQETALYFYNEEAMAASVNNTALSLSFFCLGNFSSRYTSFRLYYRERLTATAPDWLFLTEVSLANGAGSAAFSGGYDGWDDAPATGYLGRYEYGGSYTQIPHRTYAKILAPPSAVTYALNSGSSEERKLTSVKYKAAVVTNRRAYIGNVQYTDYLSVVHTRGDAVVKSPPNQFDTFNLDGLLEVSINDGDSIVKLETYADRLLIFKKNKLELLNVSQEIEFIEEIFLYKGVLHPAATFKTDFGIAWVNREGCYLYDGQKVTNLLERGGMQIIKESDWNSFTTDNSTIGYIPKKRQIVVLKDCTATSHGDSYLFDLVTQSWVKGNTAFTDSQIQTNFVTDWNGDLVHAHTSGTGTIVKWDDASAESQSMVMTTKDIDFGQPAVRKKIYKVYITYRGDATNVQVHYGVDGLAPALTFNNITSGTDGSSTGSGSNAKCIPYDAGVTDWLKAELKPSASINNINSFRLKLSGDGSNNIAADFEINDISIVYRGKNVK